MRFAEYVVCMARVRNAFRDLVGKPKGKRPVERHGSSWEDNIKMDLRDREWGGMNIIDLTEDRNQWRAIANKKNSVVSVRKRAIPTEQPPFVSEVSATFCG
jgi:hypothetical protein